MDTVLLFVLNNELYVYDYYKEKIKAVPFKDRVYFEVYDHFDLREAVEYLNYPLNYKQFKGSKVQYIYNQPMSYQLLWEEKELFKESTCLKTTVLETLLLGYCLEEGILENKKNNIVFMQNYYYIDRVRQVITRKEEIMGEEDAYVIEVEKLCLYALKEKEALLFDPSKWVVCSPTLLTLEKSEEPSKKRLFLETHCVLDQASIRGEGAVMEGDELLSYIKHVHKKFFKTPPVKQSMKALKTGCFYYLKQQEGDAIWANKHQVIGIISEQPCDKEKLIKWVEARGFVLRKQLIDNER